MKNLKETRKTTRLKNLAAIVERDGLAKASKKLGKPDRQINDMLAGRKSFGEGVALQMEFSYAPSLPPGWMSISTDSTLNDADDQKLKVIDHQPKLDAAGIQEKADIKKEAIKLLSEMNIDFQEAWIAQLRAESNLARSLGVRDRNEPKTRDPTIDQGSAVSPLSQRRRSRT